MRERIFTLVAIMIILLSVISICKAQPSDSTLPSLNIIYPPIPPNRYENSTVELQINFRLLEGSPRPSNFSFSLDGNPLIYLRNFTTTKITYWAPNVFTVYIAQITLGNLSEGNHTVNAYVDGMSVSRTFRVNSYFHPTVVKILSPINQTYSSSVPLVFTVNMPIKGAYYYMYRDYDAVFENHFNGNITMDNLSDGNYVLHLYVTTENGDEPASTSFSVLKSVSINFSQYVIGIITVVSVACIISFLLYVRHLKKTIKATSSH